MPLATAPAGSAASFVANGPLTYRTQTAKATTEANWKKSPAYTAFVSGNYSIEVAYHQHALMPLGSGTGYSNRAALLTVGSDAYWIGTMSNNKVGFNGTFGSDSTLDNGVTMPITEPRGEHTISCSHYCVDGDKTAKLCFDESIATAQKTPAAAPGTVRGFALGGIGWWATGNSTDATYLSLRFYDHALSDDERLLNRAIDRVRCFSEEPEGIPLPSGYKFDTTDGVRLMRSCAITVEPADAGTIAVDGGEAKTSQTYWGDVCVSTRLSLVAEAAEGYAFAGWRADGLTDDQKLEPTLTADFTGPIAAIFRKTDGSDVRSYTWSGTATDRLDNPKLWHDADGLPGVPAAFDNVTIPSATAATLTNSTPVYSSLTIAGTLATTDWTTCIRAGEVVIKNAGNVTVKTASTDAETNRVWISCSGLTIEAGGKIDVNTKGYQGKNGLGWVGVASKGGAGAHGGKAAGGTCQTHGSIICPQDMGSGNYSPWSSSTGGGAVYLQVAGPAVINGTITANGGKDSYQNGNAAGGSVCLNCETVSGSGTISANGGGQESNNAGKYGGGGGRIAVTYDAAKQTQVVCDVAFSVRGGLERSGTGVPRYDRCGDCGTLYFTDDQFTRRPTLKLAGRVYYGPEVMPLAGLSGESRTIADSWLVIEPDGAEVNFTGDLTLTGSSAKMNGIQLTGQHTHVTVGGTLSISGAQLRVDGGDSVSVGGDVRLEDGKSYVNSGELTFRAAATNTNEIAARPLTVGGDFILGNYGGYIPVCDPTNGAVVAATVRNFYMAANSQVYADFGGYRFGKGKHTPLNCHIGASHGGKGGANTQELYSKVSATYGNRKRPCEPGASSAVNSESSDGGGVVIIKAGCARLDGTITANGGTTPTYSAAAAGGSVFLEVYRLLASQGSISANGGTEEYTGKNCRACGGGGRIAIWYDIDDTDAAFKERVVAQGGRDDTASEEVQKWYNGEDGTVYWKPKTGLRVFVR